jgi:hypothetical protein
MTAATPIGVDVVLCDEKRRSVILHGWRFFVLRARFARVDHLRRASDGGAFRGKTGTRLSRNQGEG